MKTNRLLCSVLLFLFVALNINTSSAQVRFGVKGGFDVINNKLDFKILKASNRLGYQIGPTVEFMIPGSGFGLDVAALYGRKEYKIKDKEIDATISDFNYISVPVNIKQRFNLIAVGLFITGGVYGNVKVSGGDVKNVGDVIDEYKAKNFVFGLGAGAGVNLFSHLDVGIYFKGDLSKRYGDDFVEKGVFDNKKNQTWNIGLTYYF